MEAHTVGLEVAAVIFDCQDLLLEGNEGRPPFSIEYSSLQLALICMDTLPGVGLASWMPALFDRTEDGRALSVQNILCS